MAVKVRGSRIENGVDTIEHGVLFDDDADRGSSATAGVRSSEPSRSTIILRGSRRAMRREPEIVGKLHESRGRVATAWRGILTPGCRSPLAPTACTAVSRSTSRGWSSLGASPARALRAATIDGGARVRTRPIAARSRRACALIWSPCSATRSTTFARCPAPVFVMKARRGRAQLGARSTRAQRRRRWCVSMRECRGLVAAIALVTLACSSAAKERQAEATGEDR